MSSAVLIGLWNICCLSIDVSDQLSIFETTYWIMGIFGRVDRNKNIKSKICIRHKHVMLGVNFNFNVMHLHPLRQVPLSTSIHPQSRELSSSPDIDHPFVPCLFPSQVTEPVNMLRIFKHERNGITMGRWKTRLWQSLILFISLS